MGVLGEGSVDKTEGTGGGVRIESPPTGNIEWACLKAIPHRLNGIGLSREKFQYNLLLQYGIVPLNLPADCDGCGKNFSVPHSLSCPKGGLVMAQHNDAAK